MASIARSALLKQAASASVRPAFHSSLRTAAFHTTARRALLPPPPQIIEGSVNDAAPVPPPSPSHGSYHWTFDRLVAGALIPMTVVPFAAGSLNPTLDAILCATLLIHSHTGFKAIIVDYIPQKRMPKIRMGFNWLTNLATAVVGLALYEFETSDVGLVEAIKRVWAA
ncbi:CybS-domain-containing protein [Cercophora scortea]|uniref:Succinate dehydrogenase [ubiquinone] cytochrome b small subunit n=1 Tax=Cercophora scortea TaxID=314031 RepID=A0AAE0J4C2_9PEZI|nr:CybS-domain-containing protein [Cercophora scortea]